MALPGVAIAGILTLSLLSIVALATSSYQWLHARRARQLQARQHSSWHRQHAGDVELGPMQSRDKKTAAYASWPYNSRDEQMDGKFVPARIFATQWGSGDGETSLQCPAPVRTSAAHSRVGGGPARKKTTADNEEESDFPDVSEAGESSDPARQIWRKIEARQVLGGAGSSEKDVGKGSKGYRVGKIVDEPESSVDADMGCRADAVARQYAEAAERMRNRVDF